MYQLYYYPLNASLAPHLVLEELGADFELILVDRQSNAQKSPDYLALNPAGRIPTLVHGELVIFESPAICLYLGDSNPDSGLLPRLGNPERALCYQWLAYLNNTVQSALMVYFYPEQHTVHVEHSTGIIQAQEQRLAGMFALLDEALENKPYLVGNSITVCDYFLLMVSVWADELKAPPLSFPNLNRYLRDLASRDAVKRVCKKENYSLAPYAH